MVILRTAQRVTMAAAILTLGACGGGSSGSGTGSVPSVTVTDTAKSVTFTIDAPDYQAVSLTAEDATNVAKTLLWSLQEFVIPDTGYQLGYSSTYSQSYELETGDSDNTVNCAISGSQSDTATLNSQFLSEEGDRLRAEGDTASRSYNFCVTDSSINKTQHGSTTTLTLSGKVGSNYRAAGSVQRLTYDQLATHYGSLTEPNYKHGSLDITLDTSGRNIRGNYLATRATLERSDLNDDGVSVTTRVLEQFETVLQRFDLDLSYNSSFGDSETPAATLSGTATLGSSFLNGNVEATVIEPVTRDSVTIGSRVLTLLSSGSVRADGASGSITISFFDEYFIWAYDADGDGNDESSASVYWIDVYPLLK